MDVVYSHFVLLGFHHNVIHLEMKTRPGNIVTEAGDRVNVPWLSTNQILAFSLGV